MRIDGVGKGGGGVTGVHGLERLYEGDFCRDSDELETLASSELAFDDREGVGESAILPRWDQVYRQTEL